MYNNNINVVDRGWKRAILPHSPTVLPTLIFFVSFILQSFVQQKSIHRTGHKLCFVCVSLSIAYWENILFWCCWKCEFFVLYSNLQSMYFGSSKMRVTRWKIKRIAKLIYQYGWMWWNHSTLPILYISSSSTTPYHTHISLVTNEPVYRKHPKHRKRWKHRRKIIKNNTHTQAPNSSTSNTQKHIYTLRMIFPLFFMRFSVFFTSNIDTHYTRT